MKNALILHGTMGSPKGNWLQWLKRELTKMSYKVWVPKLPYPKKPRVSRNIKYILGNKKWKFNNDSVLIGHSSGPATILGILNELPENVKVKKCIFVSAFTENDWEPNAKLFDYKYDFAKIKKNAKNYILIHSDDDPYVPLEQSINLSKKLGGKLIVIRSQGHFNLEKDIKYKQFPELLLYVFE